PALDLGKTRHARRLQATAPVGVAPNESAGRVASLRSLRRTARRDARRLRAADRRADAGRPHAAQARRMDVAPHACRARGLLLAGLQYLVELARHRLA